MIPPYVGAIAWTQLLNPDVGYLNALLKTIFSLSKAPFNIYTEGGLIWVLTLFYSPFAFITISRAMEKWIPHWKKLPAFPALRRFVSCGM